MRARVQLAIAIRSSATLPVTIVTVAIYPAVSVESLQVMASGLNGLASLEDRAGDAEAGELVGAEQARRPVAHDPDAFRSADFPWQGAAQCCSVEGAEADVAVFSLEEGEFQFVDALKQTRLGHRKLVPVATVKAGRIYGSASLAVEG